MNTISDYGESITIFFGEDMVLNHHHLYTKYHYRTQHEMSVDSGYSDHEKSNIETQRNLAKSS